MTDLAWLFPDKDERGPILVTTAIASIILPSTLLIFLCRPELFNTWPLTRTLLVAAAIGWPLFLSLYVMVVVFKPEFDYWTKLGTTALVATFIQFSLVIYAYFRPLRIGATMAVTAGIIVLLTAIQVRANQKAGAIAAAAKAAPAPVPPRPGGQPS